MAARCCQGVWVWVWVQGCVGVGVGAGVWVGASSSFVLCPRFFSHPHMMAAAIISFGPTLAHTLRIFLVHALSRQEKIYDGRRWKALRLLPFPTTSSPPLPLYLSKRAAVCCKP